MRTVSFIGSGVREIEPLCIPGLAGWMPMESQMIKKCVVCEAEFDARGPQKTCGPACRRSWKTSQQRKSVVMECVSCGDEFVRIGRALTCSKACSEENHVTKKRDYDAVYRAENADKVRADKARGRVALMLADPDAYRKRAVEKAIKRYWENPDRARAYARQQHYKHRDVQNQRSREYGQKRTAALHIVRNLEAKLGEALL